MEESTGTDRESPPGATETQPQDQPVILLCFLRRKPGLSPAEFKQYYESRHAPLVTSLFPQIFRYERLYLDEGRIQAGEPLDVDVMTQIWFRSQTEYDAFLANRSQETTDRIIADEEQFLDRANKQIYLVGAPERSQIP